VKLYVLISSAMCRASVRETARAAIAGGADAIQLREKDLPDNQVLALAAELRELADETGKIFIVNDRADIAALVGADGVHLGLDDLPIAEARTLLRPGAVIGRSSHNIVQARAAVQAGADYISVGPIFPTTTKDAGPIAGVELYRQVSGEISLPLLPIGGITADNVGDLLAAGASRVAVCAAVCAAENPKTAAEAIKKRIAQAG
jgi:thiamine-phosphate pyrophosphorylase